MACPILIYRSANALTSEAPLDKIFDYLPDAASRRDDTPSGMPQIGTLKTAQVWRRRQALTVEMVIDQLFI